MRVRMQERRRWLLPVYDTFAWFLSLSAFAALRFDGNLDQVPWSGVWAVAALLSAVFLSVASMLKLYSGRNAVGSLDESILLAMLCLFVGLLGTGVLAFESPRPVPLSLPMAATGAALILIVGARVAYRLYRDQARRGDDDYRAVIVDRAGEAGTQLVKSLLIDRRSPYDPICFVDDHPRKRHFRAGSVRVEGTIDDLPRVIEERRIDRIIIAAPSAGAALIQHGSRRSPPKRV